ncbi:hypothetical protein DV738_g1665, partial [Chaetothyriales sp. CBS 135597]
MVESDREEVAVLRVSLPGPPNEVCTDETEVKTETTDAAVTALASSLPLRTSPASVSASSISLPPSQSETASSRGSSTDSTLAPVDWAELEKTEEQEPKDEGTDESTALLVARLERENAALATDPKAATHHARRRLRANTRPTSVQFIKKLVDEPSRQSLRYSQLPTPPMTELEFWAALVQDYRQTVERLPTLTANKIRGGVPPPLRGVVWPSIAGAHDSQLQAQFQRLAGQPSPYDGLIGKDVGRSFPNVDLFRDPDGEGQMMLRSVLKAFSLHDVAIGYCQGLGFVVGPLLMHMSEADAFCILVRLMDNYDLRSCYLPDLSGLHLRIYQFQALLTRLLPELAAHLDHLRIEPLYVSQWFLSFFAVTCPLPMLLRIYDVILSEGATETLMRVALSLMQRNQHKLRAFTEFEDAMQFLLSRSLWDTYAQQANDLVADFVGLTSLVSRESLDSLEADFVQSKALAAAPSLRSTAASLLGRFWAGSTVHSASKSSASLAIPASSTLRKSSSGHSLTPTMNSSRSTTHSDAITISTEPSISDESAAAKADAKQPASSSDHDRGLHQQIEDLLTALTQLQRQQADVAAELEREREERAEDRAMARELLTILRQHSEAINELVEVEEEDDADPQLRDAIDRAETHLGTSQKNRQSIIQSKHQLRDAVAEWTTKHELEAARCRELSSQLDARDAEHAALKESLREARQRIQDAHRDRQRLEWTIQELRSRNNSACDSPQDPFTPQTPAIDHSDPRPAPSKSGGLRDFRLGKGDPFPRAGSMHRSDASLSTPTSTSTFAKRTSSLNTQEVLSTQNHEPVSSDALLLELVNAKTAEAVARKELDESKAKLDSLRKLLTSSSSTQISAATVMDAVNPERLCSYGEFCNNPEEHFCEMALFDMPLTHLPIFDPPLFEGRPDISFNPFVGTIEAIRTGNFDSGYVYSPGGNAWDAASIRDGGLLPPLAAHQLHHNDQQHRVFHNVNSPSNDWQAGYPPPVILQPGVHTTPPSGPSTIRELSSSPEKAPDTPTPAPRATHQTTHQMAHQMAHQMTHQMTQQNPRRNREPSVEMAAEYNSEDEDEFSSDQSPPEAEDSADEDYKPGRQNRLKRKKTTTTATARTVKRSSRRNRE